MKNAMKKLFYVVLMCFTLFLVLVGCDNSNPHEGKTVVVFWSPPFAEVETRNWLTKYTDKYNDENTDNVFIDLHFIAEDAWEQTLKGAQEAGTAPQIVFVNYAEIPLKAELGMYLALDDYMSASVWDDLHDNVKEMVTLGTGKHYIYPAFVEPYSILFYSKSAFSAAGLDPNKPPKSL
ncbi:MAG: ABC transporter substrate-binding protein [Bacilli bacterium]